MGSMISKIEHARQERRRRRGKGNATSHPNSATNVPPPQHQPTQPTINTQTQNNIVNNATCSIPTVTPGLGPAISSSASSIRPQPSAHSANQDPPKKVTSVLWEKAFDKLRKEKQGIIDCGKEYNIKLVQGLIDEIGKKKEESDAKRWSYKNKHGEDVYFVDSLLGQLNKYVVIGDIALQHHPDIVALAWSGFRLLLQVATAYSAHMQAISESLEYLVRNLCCCDIYEKLYGGFKLDVSELLDTSLINLYASFLEYLYYVRQFFQADTASRVGESFFSELGQILDKVRGFERDVRYHVGIAEQEVASLRIADQEGRTQELKAILDEIQQPIHNIEQVVLEIFESVERGRRLQILGWLSNVPIKDHHSYASERRNPKTGFWLLENEKYLSWSIQRSSSILWLRGDAGSGKTILASKVIDQFQMRMDRHALAYFYCLYKNEDRNDSTTILRSIVKQICLSKPGANLPTQILSIYEKREEEGHISDSLTLRESRDLIVELSKGFHQVTIIIDALDECNPDTRIGLFHALKAIISSTTTVKFFVTGRNDLDIQDILGDSPSHYIEAADNTNDINIYIDSEIERRCTPAVLEGVEKSLLRGDVDSVLKEKVVSTLKEKANGMFMWVHFQIVAICEEHTPANVEAALSRLPDNLDKTYTQILERVNSQSQASRECALMVFRWLLCAKEPHSAKLIIESFTVKRGEAALDTTKLQWELSTLLGICQNLVIHDKGSDCLRFTHLSVQEFLQHQPGFSLEEGHTIIAETCLTVLTYHCSDAQRGSIPALYTYSCKRWMKHLERSGPVNMAIERICGEFLKPSLHYEIWCQAYIELKGSDVSNIPPLAMACNFGLTVVAGILLRNGADPNECIASIAPIHIAVENGNKEIVRLLLDIKGLDINCKDDDGNTPLVIAGKCRQEQMMFMILEKDGVDVSSRNESGKTAMHYAIKRGYCKVVNILLAKKRVDVNYKGKDWEAPLLLAVIQRQLEVLRMLLDTEGIDVNCKSKWGTTLLLVSLERAKEKSVRILQDGTIMIGKRILCARGTAPLNAEGEVDTKAVQVLLDRKREANVEVVRMLLGTEGIDVNCKDGHGITPLLKAVQEGYVEVVRMLLDKEGIDVNCTDCLGRTPLLAAAWRSNVDIARMLLDMGGIYVNCENEQGATPLLKAAQEGYVELLRMLLDTEGIDVNCTDDLGRTPLLAAACRSHVEVVHILVGTEGIDVNCKDKQGRTPLLTAAENGNVEVLQMLVDTKGIDINSKDNNNNAPITIAAVHGHIKVVRILMELDPVNVFHGNSEAAMILLAATRVADLQLIGMLLDQDGVDVNYKDYDGTTPLLFAAEHGLEEVVRMLLGNREVDINCSDDDGDTPLILASFEGHEEIVRMLLSNDSVDTTRKNRSDRTAVVEAAKNGLGNIVRMLLLKDGLEVDCANDSTPTLLRHLSRNGYFNVTQVPPYSEYETHRRNRVRERMSKP